MTENTPPWDVIDTPGWHPLPGGGYGRNPNATFGRMTPRELCEGDIVTFDTYESGELVGIVRNITIGARSAVVVVELASGSRRSVLIGNDECGFDRVSADVARTFRATLG